MKTAVVYYSMSGNTAMVAERLAETLGADLVELRPVKQYPDRGIRKFLWGGKAAVMAETPELQPCAFDAEQYGRVVLGFPVWASNVAPPLRSFVKAQKDALSGMKVAAFACQGGSGAEKALEKLRECLGGAEFEATLVLVDPKDRPDAENDRKIADFGGKLA